MAEGRRDRMGLYRIILVDDEEEVRKGIIKKINWETLGFEVVGDAENGQDALEKIEQLEPRAMKIKYSQYLTIFPDSFPKKKRNTSFLLSASKRVSGVLNLPLSGSTKRW